MKFNWKANWEILLVLVIIVIGIVITTIAAIKNKDKHLPYPTAATDEADFGQLYPATGGNIASEDHLSAGNVQSAPASAATRKPQSQSIVQTSNNRVAKANAKVDEIAPTMGALDQYSPVTMSGADPSSELFEPLTTTEPAMLSGPKVHGHHHHQQQQQHLSTSNKRHINSSEAATKLNSKPGGHKQPASDSFEPQDDIHTTRSSLGQSINATTQQYPPVPLLSPPGRQSQPDHQMITPSLAFHGPYGSYVSGSSFSDSTAAAADADTVGLNRPQTFAAARANETRFNQTISQQQALANLLATQQQQQEQFNEIQPSANQFRGQTSSGYTGTLPISLLLGDLLKLTHPTSFSGTQEESSSGGGTYNPRGILQQIRSLPGPLMSLLGQSLQSAQQQQQQQQTSTNTNQQHDASESNQNFDYRISMTPADIHSIFSRSLSRSADTLPAFAPPKGVYQPWVPPTSGGNVNHTEAQSSNNADFIATNTAGFVRAFQQQQQQQQSSDPQQYPSMDSSPFAGQQQQQSDPNQQQSQQQQQQQQQENFVYTNNNNQYQQYASQDLLAPNQVAPQAHLYASQPQQVSAFSNNPVPLGYNPPQLQQMNQQQQLQQLQQQQHQRIHSEFANSLGGLESSPKVSISQQQQQQQQQQPFNRQPIVLGAIRNQQAAASGVGGSNKAGGRTNRRKRSTSNSISEREQQRREQEFEAYASKYNDHRPGGDDDDAGDDDDSYPLSVVSPDGRPLSNKRFRSMQHQESERQVAQSSQRAPSHVEMMPSSKENRRPNSRSRDVKPNRANKSGNRNSAAPSKRLKHKMQHEMTAGSDLMSKLLGTASSNSDESEMDIDMDDDDSSDANERRKEELDDAEFGIVNEQSHADDPQTGKVLDNHATTNQDDDGSISHRGSASANGESTTYGGGSGGGGGGGSQRRNGPTRSDIEFYGHPGEETRQLKYGILGSGNYEVVNGGIYPDADESTAAVNSVANYVRKPGGLLAQLPKMHQQQAAAFMPGGRIGGFLRGSASSASPQDIADLAAAFMQQPGLPVVGDKGDELSGQLLQLIDAGNGQYLNEANLPLISQLGSGSSSRSTHASKDTEHAEDHDDDKKSKRNNNNNSNRKKNNKKKKADQSAAADQQLQQQQSSISGSRRAPGAAESGGSGSGGVNQFNKYQILPSKKVTIFSDQDLDSAPSSHDETIAFMVDAHNQQTLRLPDR